MQTVRVIGASLAGTGAELVTVEARFEPSDAKKTEVVITGLPDPVIRESRGRVESALAANALRLGGGRLVLNLVPAARRKSGEILDLPLALAAVGAGGHLDPRAPEGILFLGELGIDGTVHPVPGGLAAGLAARERGLARVVAPPSTAEEVACVPGLEVRSARQLRRVVAFLAGGVELPRVEAPIDTGPPRADGPGLDEVRGQEAGKHALLVAAAGGHGLLFVGPPGTGKSMLARHLVRLLPPPSLAERLEITRVLSAVGRWPGRLATSRPFRAPHHTASHAGLVGGGRELSPGEITLAHRGVLFLDELPEFRRAVLEALRQPLESGSVLISRAGRQVELPASFQLVAAMNPCPCGYRGHGRVPCPCPPRDVERYRRRISGPLLDRIDLRLELPPPTLDELAPGGLTGRGDVAVTPPELAEERLAERAAAARATQGRRGQEAANAALGTEELDRWAPLGPGERDLVRRVAESRALSARALQSVRRVARTLADLDGAEVPAVEHLAQALALRGALGRPGA